MANTDNAYITDRRDSWDIHTAAVTEASATQLVFLFAVIFRFHYF